MRSRTRNRRSPAGPQPRRGRPDVAGRPNRSPHSRAGLWTTRSLNWSMPARRSRDAAASARYLHPMGWATQNNLAGEARERQRVFRRQYGSSEPHRVWATGGRINRARKYETVRAASSSGNFVIHLPQALSARLDVVTEAKMLIRKSYGRIRS